MASCSDHELGRHVLRIARPEGDVLLQSLTGIVLPADATKEELQNALFLEDQEDDAISRALSTPVSTLSLTLINTWGCNLRCSHCSVLHRLDGASEHGPDPEHLTRFLEGYRSERPETSRIHAHFVGGEPLLHIPGAHALFDALETTALPLQTSVTTNGAVKCTEAVLGFLRRIDRINVSLDGDQTAHDRQRRFLDSGASPHDATIAFLEALVVAGLSDRIHVQAAVTDKHATPAIRADWYRTLIALGVPVHQASFLGVHPTAQAPRPGSAWLKGLQAPTLRSRPCCRHRASTHWVVEPSGELRPDFYEGPQLGTLHGSLEALFEAHRAHREANMPALKDPNCRACPVLGMCWGGCVQGEAVIGDRPSQFCDQKALITHVNTLAREGRLAQLATRTQGAH